MALQRAVLQPGGRELIVYGTINGAIGGRWLLNLCLLDCNVGGCRRLPFFAQIHTRLKYSSDTCSLPRLPPPFTAATAGVLYPFSSREDHDFFQHLEMHMRQEHPPLLGRDHLTYRSAYSPVKDVVDGDLCEQYPQLPADKQRSVAEELDRSVGEVLKKLEDVRNRII